MNEIVNPFIESVTQCWGCAVFDNLFQVVSKAGAAVYEKISDICFVIFGALFAFYVIWAVFKSLNPKKPDVSDKYYSKTVIRVVINSLFALALLGIGVGFPRFITRITFEPVANVALVYSQSVMNTNSEFVDQHVTYRVESMPDTGLYRPQLRDTIIDIMKTTVTLFQNYMKLGIAVMDSAFTWSTIDSIAAIFRNLIMFFLGLYLFYGFFKFFIRFCFYFVDVIVAMAMFAFMFPLGLVMMSFRGGDMPEWMSSLGKGLGTNQIKKLINAIITLASAVITYMVIMVIITRFFSDSGVSISELMNAITSGKVMDSDLSHSNLATMTLGGMVILVYVLNYINSQIPNVSKAILGLFGVSEEHKLSEDIAKGAEKLVALATDKIKTVGETIISGGEKKDAKKEGGKK
jgi:hypothetical protein